MRLAAQNLIDKGGFGLLLSMGLGKTVVTCRTIAILNALYGVQRVLVTAPGKVLRHWKEEAEEWGAGLPVVTLDGGPEERKAELKKNQNAIHLISHGTLKWLSFIRCKPFDLFVVDEGSKFRTWMGKQSMAARRIARRTNMRLLLSGSPTPNCPSEFFAQQYILDRGETLGRTIEVFRDKYMSIGGYENHEWIFDRSQEKDLLDLIAPWVLRQDSSLLDGFPEVIENDIVVELPPKAKLIYKDIEDELYTEYTTDPLFALSGSSRYSLCRQIASGGYYDENKVDHEVHDAKIEAVSEIIDETSSPVLVVYQFIHEHKRLKKAFPHAKSINSSTSGKQFDDIMNGWVAGDVPLILAQTKSISHGVDGLQKAGCTLVNFSQTDSPDDDDQTVARLARSGQKQKFVTVHRIIAKGTIDRMVLRRVREKVSQQQAILDYFKETR